MSRGTIKRERYRRRLARLYARDCNCHWCRKPTILMLGVHDAGREKRRATIDHLRDRFDPTRTEPNPKWAERTVLACLECNNRRGAERQAECVELQRRKSGAGQVRKLVRRIVSRETPGEGISGGFL